MQRMCALQMEMQYLKRGKDLLYHGSFIYFSKLIYLYCFSILLHEKSIDLIVFKFFLLFNRKCHKVRGEKAVYLPSYEESFKALANGTCRFLFTDAGNALTYINGRYCGELSIAGKPAFTNVVHFVLPKNSPYKANLTRAALQLKDEGNIITLHRLFDTAAKCNIGSSPSLTFGELQMFFVLAFAVCLILFVEMIIDPQRRKSNSDAQESSDLTDDLDSLEKGT